MKRLPLLSALTCCILLSQAPAATADNSRFLDALAMKESTNKPLGYRKDVNGVLVVGYFQISKDYWTDAYNHSPQIGGSWDRCRTDRAYAALVVMTYMNKYVPEAVKAHDYKTMSRTHNGGPAGSKSSKTLAYWADIQARMK